MVAFACAAYQAVRLKEGEYVRGMKIAEAHAGRLRERSKQLEHLARSWKSIALDNRTSPNGDATRFRRWSITTELLTGDDYKRELDALGIQLLALSRAQEFFVLSHFSESPSITFAEHLPECGGILQGGIREQELVEQAGINETFHDVLILLPKTLVDVMESEERATAKRKGLPISQIEQTSFALVQASPKQACRVIVRSMRPIPRGVVAK